MRSTSVGGKLRARALRHLAVEELGLTIQEGEHSPVDDARAALYIYHRHRKAGGVFMCLGGRGGGGAGGGGTGLPLPANPGH